MGIDLCCWVSFILMFLCMGQVYLVGLLLGTLAHPTVDLLFLDLLFSVITLRKLVACVLLVACHVRARALTACVAADMLASPVPVLTSLAYGVAEMLSHLCHTLPRV